MPTIKMDMAMDIEMYGQYTLVLDFHLVFDENNDGSHH
jgi:hypothetical protein